MCNSIKLKLKLFVSIKHVRRTLDEHYLNGIRSSMGQLLPSATCLCWWPASPSAMPSDTKHIFTTNSLSRVLEAGERATITNKQRRFMFSLPHLHTSNNHAMASNQCDLVKCTLLYRVLSFTVPWRNFSTANAI